MVYETVSGVVVGTTDPDTSDNVAYVVSETLSTTNNPAYGHLPMISETENLFVVAQSTTFCFVNVQFAYKRVYRVRATLIFYVFESL